MKKEIKRFCKILKSKNISKAERAGIIVYVFVVFMGKKPKKLAQKIGVTENDIIAGVVKINQKLTSDKVFYVKMHETMKSYFLMNNLKKIAS